ncbi:hypothetical protein HS5_12230 [Acidianus sp. HS-5]|nr:hypothetical protein HS5_12230 [Acidianus sp. HS-5]
MKSLEIPIRNIDKDIMNSPKTKVFLEPNLEEINAEGICILPEPKKKENGINPAKSIGTLKLVTI